MLQGDGQLEIWMVIQLGKQLLSGLLGGGGGQVVQGLQHLHLGQSLQWEHQVGGGGAQVNKTNLTVAPDGGDHGEDLTLDAPVRDTKVLIVCKPGKGACVHVKDHVELVGDGPLVVVLQREREERASSTVLASMESLLPAQVPAPGVGGVPQQPLVPVRLHLGHQCADTDHGMSPPLPGRPGYPEEVAARAVTGLASHTISGLGNRPPSHCEQIVHF